MEKVKAIIEMASDGHYSIYMDDDTKDYLVTGTGKTVDEAMKVFLGGYEDIKRIRQEDGHPFEEVEFEFGYDMASFLSYFSKAFTLAGLSRITGVNQGQLSHYATGHSRPSRRTTEKIQQHVHSFADELRRVQFA